MWTDVIPYWIGGALAGCVIFAVIWCLTRPYKEE